MRALADCQHIQLFMRALGAEADAETRVYFTGGATAVLLGWRPTTIDIDIKIVPERDRLLRALPQIKEDLSVNVELASPADFIPVPIDWEERSRFQAQEGNVEFYHFDLYAQALAKVERRHVQDVEDVATMIRRGLIDPRRARQYFEAIAPELYRYPAVDPRSFREAAEELLKG